MSDQLAAGAEPATVSGSSPAGRDYLTILSGTSQNVVGIVIAALATFAAQVLMTRTLGASAYGVITIVTQGAFVLSFATRAGMDFAVLRDVAIHAGRGDTDRVRTPVQRAVMIGVGTSALVMVVGLLVAPALGHLVAAAQGDRTLIIQVGVIGLPFLAATNVWLAATRGLKIMRYTLYIFWAAQPVLWIALLLVGWLLSETTWMSVLAYSMSWAIASLAAFFAWRKESRGWAVKPMEQGEMGALLRYAGPRAPAALFAQLLFWTDLFVVQNYVTSTQAGVYAAVLRAGQVVILFLTSVNLMFSPFVADLHAKGERKRLDDLFKTVTRWTLAATLPAFVILAVVPQSVLKIFGSSFASGESALLILLAGQLVNIGTGSAGFVLIMAGRTGWDLFVYAVSILLDVSMAFWLSPLLGIRGAAIANAVTFAVSNTLRILLVKRFVGIQPYDRRYLRLVPPAALSVVAAWGVAAVLSGPWLLRLVVVAAVAIAGYAGAYLVVGLTPQEKTAGRRLAGRLLSQVRG